MIFYKVVKPQNNILLLPIPHKNCTLHNVLHKSLKQKYEVHYNTTQYKHTLSLGRIPNSEVLKYIVSVDVIFIYSSLINVFLLDLL